MKALCLFSGGLDSMLAAQLLRNQNIEVVGVFFETPFFPSHRARASAETIRLPLKIVDLTESHLEIVKHPAHGYGENMNPCVDCHALMLRRTGQLLEREGADFLLTGEVLGQRPMSQSLHALSRVASESGFPGLILRPLSARLLAETIPEKRGWVQRDRLLNFSGRTRKPQIELARNLGITDYPSPAGGCLLTDPAFSKRLKDLFANEPGFGIREIELLKVGRHFRIAAHARIIVGRNKGENETIESLAKLEDRLFRAESIPGPTALALGDLSPELERLAAEITASYSDAEEHEPTEIRLEKTGEHRMLTVESLSRQEFRKMMI